MVSETDINDLKMKYGIIAHTEANGSGGCNYMFVPDMSSKAPCSCNIIIYKDELYIIHNSKDPEQTVKEYAKERKILFIKAQ